MRMKKSWALAMLAILLTGCATAKEEYLQDGFRVMTGEEIASVFSGQTVEGRYGDGSKTFVEYRSPDGRVTTIESDGSTYYGTWKIDGDLLCFVYADFPVNKCADVLKKDGRYVEFRIGGWTYGRFGTEITSIQPGNVRGLPLK